MCKSVFSYTFNLFHVQEKILTHTLFLFCVLLHILFLLNIEEKILSHITALQKCFPAYFKDIPAFAYGSRFRSHNISTQATLT